MKNVLIGFMVLFSSMAGAACPVNKQVGDTWCEKGMQWKCEKCGSEYCPIITGKKCVQDDPQEFADSRFARILALQSEQSVLAPRQRAQSTRR